MTNPLVEGATPADWPAIADLLGGANLPLDGAREAFAAGVAVVARDGAGTLMGAAAVEPYGEAGLLRSVAVAADLRGTGIGRALVTGVETRAAAAGIGELYLLTETAADWFPRLGFERIERKDVPADVAASVEFATACPVSAVAMRRRL
jgi:amino-acid N-acetyltransferase